jgi:hypothetical protein
MGREAASTKVSGIQNIASSSGIHFYCVSRKEMRGFTGLQVGDSIGMVCETLWQHPSPGSPLLHRLAEGCTSSGMAQWQCGSPVGSAVWLLAGTGVPLAFPYAATP